jgi:hypothetical protein
MTTNELKEKFVRNYGFKHPWPPSYGVDADTYACVCQAIFDRQVILGTPSFVHVAVGPHGGIMFQSVELLLVRNHEQESSESHTPIQEGKSQQD